MRMAVTKREVDDAWLVIAALDDTLERLLPQVEAGDVDAARRFRLVMADMKVAYRDLRNLTTELADGGPLVH